MSRITKWRRKMSPIHVCGIVNQINIASLLRVFPFFGTPFALCFFLFSFLARELLLIWIVSIRKDVTVQLSA